MTWNPKKRDVCLFFSIFATKSENTNIYINLT